MKTKKVDIFFWFVWFLLVIIWNYGSPKASPFEDVIVAVILSIALFLVKRLKFN